MPPSFLQPLRKSTHQAASTVEEAKTAKIDIVRTFDYSSINLLRSITTKKDNETIEKVEFTYDSEDNRTSKKVTNKDGELIEFYYYDANGDLVSISEKSGIDPVNNLMNIYRDDSGQLLGFEYKGKMYDYVYNQRGDIVAITNELQEIIARYTYDEWGNQLKVDAPTELGKEIAKANPFRYVGKFGVQYDQDTKLYFMGWRDYDAKIGRFLVADEYEGEDTNPVSFNRYLYAESDPVNNIDPDGYAPKWLKKIAKGVKKASKATYNFLAGDDIRTLKSKNTKWYQKAGASISIASNFIPGGGLASKAVKAIVKGTTKAVKAIKASKTVTKAKKVVKAPAKKAAAKVNKKPKTVPASSIKRTPKTTSSAPLKVSKSTSAPKKKASVAPKPARAATPTRVEKHQSKSIASGGGAQASAGSNSDNLLELDLQFFAGGSTKGKGKKHISRNVKDIDAYDDIKNFLGKGKQTDINIFTGKRDMDRIFVKQSDGTVHAVRMGNHEMRNPNNFHYHLEKWDENGNFIRPDQSVKVNNTKRRR